MSGDFKIDKKVVVNKAALAALLGMEVSDPASGPEEGKADERAAAEPGIDATEIPARVEQTGELDDSRASGRQRAEEPHQPPEDSLTAHYAVGNLNFNAGKFEEAAASYRDVLDEQPRCWPARYNLALSLERLERWEEATLAFTEAVALAPDEWQAELGLGVCLLRTERPEQAREAFESVLRTEPENEQALFGKGVAAQALQRCNEARKCYEALLERHPWDPELLANLAATCFGLGEYAEAQTYAGKLVAAHPEAGTRVLAECAATNGDEEAVVQHLTRLVDMAPASYALWFSLGVACQKTGRLDVARDAYRKALDIEPESAEAHANLGTVLHEMEDLPAARQSYIAALRRAPEHPGMLWNMALAAESGGALEEAQQLYARVATHQPGWSEAQSRLSRLQAMGGEAPRSTSLGYRRGAR